jgi:hypothetical protein
MFTPRVVAGIAYVALTVARFVALEVVERLRPAFRHRSSVTMLRIVAVVDVAVKAARTMKPWTGSDEQPASKPVRTIVAVG